MQKALLLSLTLALAGVGVAAAQGPRSGGACEGGARERRFEQLDANGDGKLTQAEMLAQHEARFAEADQNHDGKLSQEERKAARAQRMEQRFAERDANRDGRLSGDELPRRGHKLSRADSDGDGALSLQELSAHKRSQHAHAPKQADVAMTKEGVAQHTAARFAKLDTNQDGSLSREEFAAAKGHGRREKAKGAADSSPQR